MKITITVTIPKLLEPRRLWKWSPLLIGAGFIVALIVLFPLRGPDSAVGLHLMPCADLDGDTDVDVDDVNIVASYFFKNVPPAPAQVDMTGDGLIRAGDITYVLSQIGATTGCQDAPVACQGGPCPTKTPTMVLPPTNTPTRTRTPTATPTPAPVGGIAQLANVERAPVETADGSDPNAGWLVGIAAVGAVSLGVVVLYARGRRAR